MDKLVFTNGCFDLLHPGHVYILKEASKLGKLVVGLNSDSSVRGLKGPQRPIQNQATRQKSIESLDFIEKVIIFYEDTPLRLIEKLKPDIVVKGGDYKVEDVVGYGIADEIVIIPLLEGHSTTDLIKSRRNNRAC